MASGVLRGALLSLLMSLVVGSFDGYPEVPPPPSSDHVTCSSVRISWPAQENMTNNISGYVIRYKPVLGCHNESSWSFIDVATEDFVNQSLFTATIDGLAPLKLYLIELAAWNELGNSSFSEALFVATTLTELQQPQNLQAAAVRTDSATLSWNAPDLQSCGVREVHYELHYSQTELSLPPSLATLQVHSSSSSNTTEDPFNSTMSLTYSLQDLRPFTEYTVRVRAIVSLTEEEEEEEGGVSWRRDLTSSFSEVFLFTTHQAAPSGAPQAVSAYLTRLQSSAHFQWDPVPPTLTNGPLTAHTLTCHHSPLHTPTQQRVIRRVLGSRTYQYELGGLTAATEYRCSVSASTSAGQGPSSAPIHFQTPPDLNAKPIAPNGASFNVVPPESSNIHDGYMIQGYWDVDVCQDQFSCREVLGYIMYCRSEQTNVENRVTVWQSDIAERGFLGAVVTAELFTTYNCRVASFNSYGISIHGTVGLVQTPEAAPTVSPMQLYTTEVHPNRAVLHWSFSQQPPVGRLVRFFVYLHYRDTRFPDQEGVFIVREGINVSGSVATEFSHLLIYLMAGVEYNVFVTAATIAGEGPRARMSFKTIRTAPEIAPINLQSEVVVDQEPFQYQFTWQLPQSGFNGIQSPVHSGFIIQCFENSTNITSSYLPTAPIVTHSIFTDDTSQMSFTATLAIPATCSSENQVFLCNAQSFNERGEGPSSELSFLFLPCISEQVDPLDATFLADPYYSLTFLSVLLLLLLVCTMAIIALCVCNSLRTHKKKYSSEYYGENYISMSTAPTIKSYWLDHSRRPTTIPSSAMDETDDPYNPYDEIPGASSRPENLYDEIRPRTRVVIASVRDSTSTSAVVQQQQQQHSVAAVNQMAGEVTSDCLSAQSSSAPSSVGSQPSSEVTLLTNLSGHSGPELIRPTSSSPTPEYIEITQPQTPNLPSNSSSSSSSSHLRHGRSKRKGNTKAKSAVLQAKDCENPYTNIPGVMGTGSCCVEMEGVGCSGRATATGGYDRLEPLGGGGGGGAGGDGYDHLMKRESGVEGSI